MAEEQEEKAPSKLPPKGMATLEGLRKLWGETGRDRVFMAADQEVHKGHASIEEALGGLGFGGLDTFAEENEATNNTHVAGQRLQAAWKKTLEREGKMMHPGQSVNELITGSKEKMGEQAAQAQASAKAAWEAEQATNAKTTRKSRWVEDEAPWDGSGGEAEE